MKKNEHCFDKNKNKLFIFIKSIMTSIIIIKSIIIYTTKIKPISNEKINNNNNNNNNNSNNHNKLICPTREWP